MISLIMCLGFSVDFSAHIANHFVRSNHFNVQDRIQDCFAAYGHSILQSAVSTLLAVSILLSLPSYILTTFSKMMILVIVFGVLHGLVILPVLLTVAEKFGISSKFQARTQMLSRN